MQLVRHSIAITKTHYGRHLNYKYHHKQSKTSLHYHYTFKYVTTEITQIDLDDLPSANNNNNVNQSQSNYKPHQGTLPAKVMNSLAALNINVEAETHKVSSSNSIEIYPGYLSLYSTPKFL